MCWALGFPPFPQAPPPPTGFPPMFCHFTPLHNALCWENPMQAVCSIGQSISYFHLRLLTIFAERSLVFYK